jgi:hypothetical protein
MCCEVFHEQGEFVSPNGANTGNKNQLNNWISGQRKGIS